MEWICNNTCIFKSNFMWIFCPPALTKFETRSDHFGSNRHTPNPKTKPKDAEEESFRRWHRRSHRRLVVAITQRNDHLFPLHLPLRITDPIRRLDVPLLRRRNSTQVRRLRSSEALDGDNHKPPSHRLVQKRHSQRSHLLGTRLPSFNCLPELHPRHPPPILQSRVRFSFQLPWPRILHWVSLIMMICISNHAWSDKRLKLLCRKSYNDDLQINSCFIWCHKVSFFCWLLCVLELNLVSFVQKVIDEVDGFVVWCSHILPICSLFRVGVP